MPSSASMLWARAQWRQRGAALGVCAVVLALTGSLALAAAGSAQRSASAMDRLRAETSAADIALASTDERFDPDMPTLLHRLTPLMGIDALSSQTVYFIQPVGGGVAVIVDFVAIAQEQQMGAPANVPKLVAGRLPDPAEPDEVAVSEKLAERLGLSPGDRIALESASEAWVDTMFSGADPGPPDGPPLDMLVAGVVVAPIDFSKAIGAIFLSPAFGPEYDDHIGHYSTYQARLRDPSVADTVLVSGVGGVAGPELATAVFASPSEWRDGAQVGDGLRVVATGLWLFAGVVALAGIAVFALLTRRLGRSASADVEAMSALGLDRRGMFGCGLALFAPVVLAGMITSLAVAPLISTRLRLGLAASVEPDRGTYVDVGLLVVGGAALTVVAVAASAPCLITRPSRDRAIDRAPTARVPLRRPIALTVGIREALGGRTLQVPSTATIAMSTAMMIATVASLVFGASLGRLDAHPHAWGNPANVTIDFGEREGGAPNEPYAQGLESLASDDRVRAVTGMTLFDAVIDGASHMSVVLDAEKGDPILTVLTGRAPATADEIALGKVTIDALGLGLGDDVPLTVGDTTETFQLVGQVAFPDGDLVFDDGAAITPEGSRRFGSLGEFLIFQASVTWADGVDAELATGDLEQQGYDVFAQRIPSVVDNLGQVGRLPAVLAGFFALLVIAVVGYSLTLWSRSGGRQIAILSALGFPPRSGRSVVRFQALTLGVATVALGVPVGLVAGRTSWALVVDRAGIAVFHANPTSVVTAAGIAAIAGSVAVATVLMSTLKRRPLHSELGADRS